MKNEELRKKIDDLKNEALIMFLGGGGLGPEPGFGGMALKTDGELYKYGLTYNVSDGSENGEVTKISDLPKDEVESIEKFIVAEKIIETEYEDQLIMDASFNLYINYKGQHKEIVNDRELFNKVEKLFSAHQT